MKTYDFTTEKWHDIIKPIDDTPCVYCNDNDDVIHVPTLFDMVDYAKLRREGFEVVR
mgnify:CR=1 FL=1